MALASTNFKLEGLTAFYKGKVRDVYTINDQLMVMIASDRISAFDVVLPKAIPFKGQVLNQTAAHFLQHTKDIVPNWVISQPDENVTIGYKCTPFKVEMVIRAYLAGHAWREYKAGKRLLCGEHLPEGLKENDRLPRPIITPSTKAEVGHDMDISKAEIISTGLVNPADYAVLEQYTLALFEKGTNMALEKGLILVDTKYEFGKKQDGTIVVIDEIHTPDSSRYFYANSYEQLQERNEPQRQLSKEFVRKWLIENDFQGKDGQSVPFMPQEFVEEISNRYIEPYEKITGLTFVPRSYHDVKNHLESSINQALKSL